ncbi:N,N-dimethylformamidase beta subunit family domain-containing protein [Kriegella aquimaris]|uniref:N,N-dimethylformamidase beta subunit-like C-terminal domain-containing protein n=1 Tax=Kriegella aquimaris TaxID=192904 RepID=A0A1G9JRE3_9FLAO|nr:N,N-dimethylformamidase beta subunit family domain-containing protein [Kriegella aquimaris]SDL40118.1 hypothetical protein SAMN04488514_101680 [Kriegella aquimaris]
MLNKSSNHPIAIDNERPGTASWKLNHPATNREIEGYASHTSINKGEFINLFVNTAAEKFSLEVFRMGWYNGLGGRSITEPVTLPGMVQKNTLPDTHTGLIECDWKNPYKLCTDETWLTGIYVAKLQENSFNKQSYIIFVVRDDENSPDILFQLPVTTYQAYNYWGGKSLYDWGSGSHDEWGSVSGKRASHVSFNRPYACSNNRKAAYGMGAGEFFTNIQPITTHDLPISSAAWDYNMVRWLEKNKYNVGYITNIDTHSESKFLSRAKIFMSHGHDEYWSSEMRSNVEKILDDGTSLTFFSSNAVFWQVRLEPSSSSNAANRTMVCYKDVSLDPITNSATTVNFRDKPIDNPESKLIGVQHFMDPVDSDIIISNASHWIYEGLDAKNGDRLHGLLGYEIDGITEFSPKNITILATSPGKNLLENNYAYTGKVMFKRINRKMNSLLVDKLKFPKIAIKAIYIIAILAIFILSGVIVKIGAKGGIFALVLCSTTIGALLVFWFLQNLKALNNRIVKKGDSHMTLYETEKGAKVFATGSMQWSWGLDDYNAPKLRSSRASTKAETITHNVLSAFGATTS